jgi:hypothetical protein
LNQEQRRRRRRRRRQRLVLIHVTSAIFEVTKRNDKVSSNKISVPLVNLFHHFETNPLFLNPNRYSVWKSLLFIWPMIPRTRKTCCSIETAVIWTARQIFAKSVKGHSFDFTRKHTAPKCLSTSKAARRLLEASTITLRLCKNVPPPNKLFSQSEFESNIQLKGFISN